MVSVYEIINTREYVNLICAVFWLWYLIQFDGQLSQIINVKISFVIFILVILPTLTVCSVWYYNTFVNEYLIVVATSVGCNALQSYFLTAVIYKRNRFLLKVTLPNTGSYWHYGVKKYNFIRPFLSQNLVFAIWF